MSEERYESRQKQIESAALDVFVEQGFENTTLEAVAARLGYTKQSIYYYYRNKEDLVLSFCRHILDDAQRDVLSICASDANAKDTLAKLIQYYFTIDSEKKGFFTLHRNLVSIMGCLTDTPEKHTILSAMKEIPEAILAIIREGIESGTFRDEDPKLLSGILFGMIAGISTMHGYDVMQDISREKASALAVEIIIKGILA